MTARILAAGATLCACQLMGTGWGSAGRAVPSDVQGTQFTSVSTYLVVRARINNEQDAREIGSKLVRDYLSGLGGRAVFVDKDYANITTADCTVPGTCEAIRVSVEEKSHMVTYHIESRLLSSVPDRAIWDEAQPASCSIAPPDRPATECVDPMLHRLARKVLAHDAIVHRVQQ